MNRYQVYWLVQAEEDLATLWAKSRLRSVLTRAVIQLETKLAERAHDVGRPHALSRLDDEAMSLLLKRLSQVPEGLRAVEIEGIEIQFFVPPETKLAVVVRLRSIPGFV